MMAKQFVVGLSVDLQSDATAVPKCCSPPRLPVFRESQLRIMSGNAGEKLNWGGEGLPDSIKYKSQFKGTLTFLTVVVPSYGVRKVLG